MKRIDRSSHQLTKLPTTTLYRRDVDEICEELNTFAGPGGKLLIRSGSYEFDSLDEVKDELGNRVDRLRLEGKASTFNSLELKLEPRETYVIGDLESRPVRRVEEIILRRRRPLGLLPEPPRIIMLWTAAGILGIGVVGLVSFLLKRGNASGPSIVLLLSVGSLLVGLSFLPPPNRILLVRQHEHQTFWTRHSSDFVKAGFGLGGSILGYAFRFLQEYFKNSP